MSRACAILAIFLGLAACSRPPEQPKGTNEPLKQYPMRGSVIRLDAQDHLATIKNEKIEGWMESMTMDFPVKNDADFAKLQAGETIRATVYVQGLEYWVGNVQPEAAK